MAKRKYQLSSYLRVVSNPGSEAAMVYHTLRGNPRIVNAEGIRFLDLFRQPATEEKIYKICDENPRDTIQELTKIFFLVEHGFNEKEFLHKQKSQYLLKVNRGETVDRMGLAISDSCNFGCTHCIHFQPSDNNVVLPIYQKPVEQLKMSWETAKKCIDCYVALMKKQGRNCCKVHFGNAEPLLNWMVIEKALRYCDDMKDITFEFAINTNLTLVTKRIAEILKKYHVRIATSLDGTSQANDAIRITKGGRGTFDSILEKFNLLNKIGYPLDGFSVTVTNKNFVFINTDIIELAAQRGMKSIAFDL